MSLRTLADVTTGRYLITTYSGSQHVVDFDALTVTRKGAEGHEFTSADHGTPDGVPLHFALISGLTVGECMVAANAVQWRRSSTIQSIEACS